MEQCHSDRGAATCAKERLEIGMKLLGGGGLQLQRGRLQVHLLQQHQDQVLAATAPDIQLGKRATPYPQHSTTDTVGM